MIVTRHTMSEQLDAYIDHVLASVKTGHTNLAGKVRMRELTELVIQHWPAYHLQIIAKKSRHHADLEHALNLCRAQVREHYEARHGISVLWGTILAAMVRQIMHFLVNEWFRETVARKRMAALALELAKRDRVE